MEELLHGNEQLGFEAILDLLKSWKTGKVVVDDDRPNLFSSTAGCTGQANDREGHHSIL